MAHELSHIVLNAVDHKLRKHEEAVDLTVMLLGYREIFRTGCQQIQIEITGPQKRPIGNLARSLFDPLLTKEVTMHTHTFGYLSLEEVNFAATIMDYLV